VAQGSAGARAAVVGGLRPFPLRIVQYASLFVAGLIVAKALGPKGRAAYALPTSSIADPSLHVIAQPRPTKVARSIVNSGYVARNTNSRSSDQARARARSATRRRA